MSCRRRYFETLGIPVLDGRRFDETDTHTSRPVVVINDRLASRFFSGSAVGRHLTDSHGVVLEIVGVVRSGVNSRVNEPSDAARLLPAVAGDTRSPVADRPGGHEAGPSGRRREA